MKRRLRALRAGSRSHAYPNHQLASYDSNGIGSARSTDGLFPGPQFELGPVTPPSSYHHSSRHSRIQSYPPTSSSHSLGFSSRHKSRASISTAVSTSLQQEIDPTATTHVPRSRVSEIGVALPSGTQSARNSSSMSIIVPIDSPLEESVPYAFPERVSPHGGAQQKIFSDSTNRLYKHDSVTLPSCPDPCLTSRAGARRAPSLTHNLPSPVDVVDRFFDIPLNVPPSRTDSLSPSKLKAVAASELRALSPGPSSR